MNKSIHQRLNAQVIAAAAAVALAVPTASLARTVEIAAIKDGAATAAFGDADGRAYTLAWGYGNADGGAATNAWAHFETLGEVAAGDTSRSVALPAGWGDTATHLRFFLLEPELPAEATRVEYIEATGTQWIDTGVNLCSNDTVVADYANPAALLTKSVDLFGVHKHGMTARYFFSYSSGTTTMLFHRANGTQGATSTATDVTATLGTRQTVTMKIGPGTSSIVSASGETLFSETLTSQTVKQDATAPLAIFACNSSQYGIMALSAAKIYAFRIYDENNALRLDLVPCTVNGTPAMFDRVDGGYLYNVGTGDFATGATMATPFLVAAASATASASEFSSPDAYLDYVEATGTQWIDSGVNLRSNDTVVVDYGNPASIQAKSVDLFGVHKSGLTARCVFSYSGDSGSSTIVFHKANGTQGATSTSTGVSVTPGTRQTVTMKIGAGTSSIVAASGERLYSGSLGGTIRQDATGPLYVFACNSSENGLMAISAAKLYSFRIYAEDGSLAHHFLPCKKGDAAALFDKQTGRILYPQGGALVAGPVLPRPAELVEWVQADGADGDRRLFLDTEVVGKAGVGMVAEMMWTAKPAGNAVENVFCGAASSGSKHFWLYDAVADAGGNNATHRMGYNGWKLQLSSNNVVQAGTRYRVESSLAAGAQHLHVGSQNGTGAERGYTDSAAIDTERTLYVFANNNAGSAEPVTAAARLYSLVLTNELGVVRDFIPCVADNGKAGLYDRFSERVFFPQAAVGSATAAFDFATEVGAATNVLAEAAAGAPAARLSYVESNGTSDFVNLGVIARDGTKMVADLEWTVLPDDDVFCGARVATSGANSETRFYLYNAYGSSPLHAMGYGNGNATVSDGAGYVTLGTRYRIETTLEDGAQTSTVRRFADGAWSAASTRTAAFAGPMQLGIPLYLFARDLGGTADAFAAARVYSLKLWQKNGNGEYELVRDLVPAKGPEGGAALWDRVTNRYFRNAGGRYGLTAGVESPWIAGFMMRFR